MFRKELKVSSQNLLKSSECKKFKESLLQIFPALDNEALSLLFPPKEKIVLLKLSSSRTLLYQVQENVLIVDIDGRKNYYPTAPNMIPRITVFPQVWKYLESGADLMLPGVVIPGELSTLGTIQEGQKRYVNLLGNGAAVAVGDMMVDSAYIQKNGKKGKAMKFVHTLKDLLWQMGSKEMPPQIEDPLFKNMVSNVQEQLQLIEVSETVKEEDQEDEEVEEVEKESKEEVDEDKKEVQLQEEPATSEIPQMTPSELLEYCFMVAIKTKLKDKNLPILLNTLSANYILPARPVGTNLDVKKTQWKKAMEAKELVRVEEVSEGVLQLIQIDRSHPDYRNFKPLDVPTVASEQEKEEAAETSDLPLVTELLKPPSGLLPVFSQTESENDTLFTSSEAKEFLTKYIAAQSLTDPNNSKQVILDPVLSSVFGKEAKSGSMLKKELFEKLPSKMIAYYQLNRDGNTEIRKGFPKPLIITLEHRQSGKKHVTYVAGLENFGIVPEQVASELNKLFAASTSVQQLPGKNLKEVFIQGNVVKNVTEHFCTKYGVPKKYFEFKEKGKKK